MLLKQLSIPLVDLRIKSPDIFKKYIFPMASDPTSGASHTKRKEKEDVISEKESQPTKKLVMSSDSEDEYRPNLKEESSDSETPSSEEENSDSETPSSEDENSDSETPSSEEDDENEDPKFDIKRAVKKPREKYQKKSKRQTKVTKYKGKNTESETPSSEEDDENEDPNFDIKKEERKIKKRKEMNRKGGKRESSSDTASVKKKPMSAYELMVEKNREERMAFLQSLKIDEAKAGLKEIIESVTKKKVQPVKRKHQVAPAQPQVLRKSRRLTKSNVNLSETSLYFNSLQNALSLNRNMQKPLPSEMTFKEALESKDFYENYETDVKIPVPESTTKFVYDKSVFGKMTLNASNIAKVTPTRTTALTWHPSPEQMIIAAGDILGHLGIWNVQSGDPYVFNIHLQGITHLQFSPYNQAQLISSSYDGILRCGDMVQREFSEIYNVSNKTCCTYFDVLSSSTYLVSQINGQVALVDKRTQGKSYEKKVDCHKYPIKTVNIHPTEKSFFITAENRGSIRLWDLRKLQSTPVADITHHKHSVHSAFFSPVTGNSMLTISKDNSIRIFNSEHLTSNIKVKVQKKLKICAKGSLIYRATWLPNSEEAFMVGCLSNPRKIEVYDKNMFVYSFIPNENFRTSYNVLHSARPALAGANSSGKVMVFV